MRIEWLDAGCNEAIITRGVLWWKRRAHVRDVGTGFRFVSTGDDVGGELAYVLRRHKHLELSRRIAQIAKCDRNWQPVRALPPARIERR